MSSTTTNYGEPQAKSRLDTMATSLVLATMVASVLVGALLVESDAMLAGTPERFASTAEAYL